MFNMMSLLLCFMTSKKEGKDQESIQSSTTPDPGYQLESDNGTIRHHKREPRGRSFRMHRSKTLRQEGGVTVFADVIPVACLWKFVRDFT